MNLRQSQEILLLSLFCSLFSLVSAQEKIAVIDFKSDGKLSQSMLDSMTQVFISYFHPKSYSVADCRQTFRRIEEQNPQHKSMTQSQMLNACKGINMDKLVVGKLRSVDDKLNANIRVMEVMIGKTSFSVSKKFLPRKYKSVMRTLAKRLTLKMNFDSFLKEAFGKSNKNSTAGFNPESQQAYSDNKPVNASTTIEAGETMSAAKRRCLEAKVRDYDGNTYQTIYIGNQCWLKENMRSTHSHSGMKLVCYPPYDFEGNVIHYGYLYDWKSAMSVCPVGWHLPTDKEWLSLEQHVREIEQNICGNQTENIAKSMAANWGWGSSTHECAIGSDVKSNDATGFGVLPAGIYNSGYFGFGYYANFWCSTEMQSGFAYDHGFNCNNAKVTRFVDGKESGFSVRCVRN